MTAAQIRQQFLDFFKEKGHQIVPSAPIVVKNDPTLLFTNAGMNQFKDYFLGNKTPDAKRVADTQKCLRVSGKHNDLEEVGVDTYHHTMFEMLGNWSFGDYFKKEAIAWSWELLTEVYKIDKSRLYVTVFEGDAKENLPFDQEAYDEWKKWTIEERILKGNKKDNFWEMGDTGPCGPCSEIHVDCRSDEERAAVEGATLVNADHPQVIEIWNNVFMQFNRLKDGSLQPLPATHVDTGMGFERLVRVLQGKTSNYDTDVFTETIKLTEQITGKQYDFSDSKQAVAFRVLADHIRAIAFTIADGQLPSSNGAGYVIRRILRRAVRYYYSYLDYKTPLLFQLLPHIANQFEQVFPELFLQKDFVTRVIKEEEESFLRTLEKGIKRFDEYYNNKLAELPEHKGNAVLGTSTNDVISQIQEQNNGIVIDGKFAFELNDTYGFPVDLTSLMAQEVNAVVDINAFEAELKQQKDRSRAATAIDTEDWVTVNEIDKSTFVGYNDLLIDTRLARYRKVKAKGKEQYQLVLETTPFYAESGGQVGDTGVLVFGDEEISVTDTKKENDLIIHFADKIPAQPEQAVVAKVDWERRILTSYNHTATHLMHAALRQVLGAHVAQKGSMVNANVLRFDFSHFAKMTDEEIRKVEQIVNEKIRENIPVVIKEMSKEDAIAMGAMALFGEKYGDTVRTVIIDPNYSIELCGGTHVGHTGMIGVFSINAESAVAAGVRRIEALTGPAAIQYYADKVAQSKQITELLKAKDPIKAIEKLMEDKAALEKRLEGMEARQLVGVRNELLQKDEMVNIKTTAGQEFAINFIGDIVEVSSMDALRKLAGDFKNHLRDHVIVLCSNIDGKANVVIAISDTVANAATIDAGEVIKNIVAPLIKGGGGGQKTLATAGGTEVGQLKEVIQQVKASLV
ncbi:alanine--tRNA ligase [Taibaiella lutea]|uniref:Alanine--tRNA ligase n=1 Tax=Taibaiella lutea TaxID=2608001 RepID=A0A5M6CPM7_9BACT|nr:alanine--tRNA ligase [Taibaiella lutea]KAA5537238.1 alanine--tRNA ligase [Taibaiella lutea]